MALRKWYSEKSRVDAPPESRAVVAAPVQYGQDVDHTVPGLQMSLDTARKGNTRVF